MTPRRALLIAVALLRMLPSALAQGSQADDLKQLRTKAEQGDAAAQFNLGAVYANGLGVPQDYGEALKWFRKAADAGYAAGEASLGYMYDEGLGLRQNYSEAAKWYRKAADGGNVAAQSSLAVLYLRGLGVPQDYGEALKWFHKAADAGFADAQFNLGVVYYYGQGVPVSYNEAAKWYRKAADGGNVAAQFTLGIIYASGRGMPQSYAEAMKWYRKAADAGYADAQFNLGAAYANGQGVRQNPAQGYMWLNLAASGATGDKQKQYADARDELARKMTSEQIAEAQAAANGDKQAQNNLGEKDSKKFVPMLQEGGIYKVPVLINNAITLNFVVDSGATDVSIPADVVTTLMRTGTITQSDFIGTQTYTLADGSTTSSRTFRVKSLKVGDIVLQNVTGSVANANGDLLLGQSFLGRFKSWSIDNPKHSLVLE